MNSFTRSLLAASAIGAITMASASAMPFNHLPGARGANDITNVRAVCSQNGHCYNTARANRRPVRSRYHAAPRYYAGPQYYAAPQYYRGPQYGYYNNAPLLGIGIGPFGLSVW